MSHHIKILIVILSIIFSGLYEWADTVFINSTVVIHADGENTIMIKGLIKHAK